MGFSGRGWYTRYIDFRKRFNENLNEEFDHSDKKFHDTALYKIAQPSGIMYGHPVIPANLSDPALNKLKMEDRMRVVLLENMMHSAALNTVDLSGNDYNDFISDFSNELITYYQSVYPELHKKGKNIWGKSKSNDQLVEEIINDRIYIRSGLLDDFWSRFFHNSLLFIDVFFFKEWSTNMGGIHTLDEIPKRRDSLRQMLLKLIAAAANADNIIQSEERKLYNIFLKSADLSPELEKEARTYIDEKLTLKDIDFPKLDSWILKKYFLELAILTIWADKDVAEEEKEFLEDLRVVLGFTKEELDTSFLAIESFVLENWEEIHFLQSKNNYQIVGQLFVKRFSEIALRNKERIETEIRESKELVELLNASTKRKLNPKEKEIVRAQLIDILKVLPTFVIIALPGTFITLPLLLKILPKSAFPSAFQDD